MSYQRLAQALLNGRPYFGAAVRALQGDPVRHQYFLPVVRRLAESQSPPLTILEVGSWAGASTVSWAKALEAARYAGKVTCVDTWSPYFDLTLETARHYADMDEAARAGDIFQLFLHNIRACGVDGLIRYCVGDSVNVLQGLPAESCDLIYVDGSHLFDVVRSDLAHAKRLLRENGILCGDDLELQRGEVDPEEQLARIAEGLDYVFSGKAGTYYHPGVTEAVAVEIGEVSAWNGFWAVQKEGASWRAVELDLRDARIPDHIQAAVEAERLAVVRETASFNLVKTSSGYPALAKSLGPTEPLVERLGERDLGPLVLVGTSLEEVQAKVAQAEAALRTEAPTSPELVGEYSGFNLAVRRRRDRPDWRQESNFLTVGEAIFSIIIPTRGRPDSLRALFASVTVTTTRPVLKVGGYGYVQMGPLYHSPFGHHMFAYFQDYP